MANRNKGRRGRSRKQRPDAQARSGQTAGRSAEHSPDAQAKRSPGAQANRPRDTHARDERPRAPWHPLPLSELLIVVGAIGIVVGLHGGRSHGGPPFFTGIAAVAIGAMEVTLREHMSGYRSHTLILALAPVVVFHSVVAIVAAALTRLSWPLINVVLLAVDVPLFTLLFRLMKARFLGARHRRTVGGR